VSGEAAQQAAFQLGDQFLNVMLDPFVDGRCGIGGTDRPPLGYPPDCEEVAPSAPARGYFKAPPMYTKAPPLAPPVYEPHWASPVARKWMAEFPRLLTDCHKRRARSCPQREWRFQNERCCIARFN
jgi:hypothetical protein